MKASILVIDDDKLIRKSLNRVLTKDGYKVLTAGDAKEGLELVKKEEPDLVLLDLKLPDVAGLEALKDIRSINEKATVIILTAYADVGSAVEAMKSGAYDYIAKPYDLDELRLTISKAIREMNLEEKVHFYERQEREKYRRANIIGECAKMKEVYELIDKVSQSPTTTVLIQGESGTGKELVARAIHYSSERADKPLIELDSSVMPETLWESEMFGHEKGAFTDAKRRKKGLVELADGGSLLLDEVGDLKLAMQVKLLRFLETKTFRRVGGAESITVDVRLIAATNKDLQKAVNRGEFREDLYYRLKVFSITLPPLRERGDDILLIAYHSVKQYNKEFKKKVTKISPEAENILMNYEWPGNVRELKNVIERAMILVEGDEILPKHLPGELISSEQRDLKPKDIVEHPEIISLEQLEKDYIKKVLDRTNGNKAQAARLLGISRQALITKVKKYGEEND